MKRINASSKKELKNCNRRVYKRRGRKYFEVSKVFFLLVFLLKTED